MIDTMELGLQKLTLLDYPGNVACTVFLPGCNFRCPFCHNASLVTGKSKPGTLTTFPELKEMLSKRKGILDGICISGGEPLMRNDIFELLAELKAAGLKVKLDTNGSFPDKLKEAVARGLIDAVAMDVKNTPEKYEFTAGVSGIYGAVAESIGFIKNAPLAYCEFRTTVVKQHHTVADLLTIAENLRGAEHYFLQKFIDSGDLISTGLEAMPDEEMRKALSEVQKILPAAQLRGI